MTRTLAALLTAGAIGWGMASGAGVAMATGAFPQGAGGPQGVPGVVGSAGPAGPEGPAGEPGGESGMWRDYTSNPAVAGTTWGESVLRRAVLDLGHSECRGLNSGRTPEDMVSSDSDIPLGVQKAIVDAAIANLCPDYGPSA